MKEYLDNLKNNDNFTIKEGTGLTCIKPISSINEYGLVWSGLIPTKVYKPFKETK